MTASSSADGPDPSEASGREEASASPELRGVASGTPRDRRRLLSTLLLVLGILLVAVAVILTL